MTKRDHQPTPGHVHVTVDTWLPADVAAAITALVAGETRASLPPQIPPRMLTKRQAAAYCGTTQADVARNVVVTEFSNGRKRYDRKGLDRWLDSLGGGQQGEEVSWADCFDDQSARPT